MREIGAKLVIALAIFVVSFLSCAAPLKIISFDEHIFSAGNLLAAGILLAAGLVHQLPDSMTKLQTTAFPLAPFISGLTFCIFLILEEYLHAKFGHQLAVDGEEGGNHQHHAGHSHGHDDHKNCRHEQDKGDDPSQRHRHHDTTDPAMEEGHEHESTALLVRHQHSEEDRKVQLTACSSFQRCESTPSTRSHHQALESFRSKTFALEHHHHHHDDHVAEHMHGSLLASVILLSALSIHSIFEGMAIGVSSNPTEVTSTCVAVLAHKAFAGFALGSAMVASQMDERHFFILVSVFAFCGVLGIFLGMIFETVGTDSSVVGTIQAVVAGTFLYVSIVDIGLKEILLCRDSALLGKSVCQRDMAWSKLAAFLIGYLVMSGLAIFL